MNISDAYNILVLAARHSQGDGDYHQQIQLASSVLAQFIRQHLDTGDAGVESETNTEPH